MQCAGLRLVKNENGGLQLVDNFFFFFLYIFPSHCFLEMSLKKIEQKVWEFEHSLIDGFF